MRKWLCFLLAAMFLPVPVLFSGCAGQTGARVRDEYVIEAAYEDGTRERLFSGEVSLQLPPGTKGETL